MKNKQRGEIATIVTLGTLLVLGVSTLVSSLLLNNNKQTTKTKAAEQCFNLTANVEVRPEGSKKAFYVSVNFESQTDGQVQLFYNGLRVTGWNELSGGRYNYGPAWTQPFTKGNGAAGIAALPADNGMKEMPFTYEGWHSSCVPQSQTINCTIGVNESGTPYLKGDACTATNFDANAGLSQPTNPPSQRDSPESSAPKAGDPCRYPQEDAPGVVNCYEGNYNEKRECKYIEGVSTGNKISCEGDYGYKPASSGSSQSGSSASVPTNTPQPTPTSFRLISQPTPTNIPTPTQILTSSSEKPRNDCINYVGSTCVISDDYSGDLECVNGWLCPKEKPKTTPTSTVPSPTVSLKTCYEFSCRSPNERIKYWMLSQDGASAAIYSSNEECLKGSKSNQRVDVSEYRDSKIRTWCDERSQSRINVEVTVENRNCENKKIEEIGIATSYFDPNREDEVLDKSGTKSGGFNGEEKSKTYYFSFNTAFNKNNALKDAFYIKAYNSLIPKLSGNNNDVDRIFLYSTSRLILVDKPRTYKMQITNDCSKP
ncbi:MAG: hypothetical protein HYW86_01050 [Candidatus Roizmanbacteria bacterium]|nr:MAG: hypothetical protein HYW86_01050 [Candidatus Roizmanbacteria bacterium]